MEILNFKLRKKLFFGFSFLLILFFFCIPVYSSGESQEVRRIIGTDLYFQGISLDKISTNNQNNRVKISVKISNRLLGNCAGPFVLKISKSSSLNSKGIILGKKKKLVSLAYFVLDQVVINRLCGTLLVGGRGAGYLTKVFYDTIPIGATRKYKVELDSGRQVAEANETNNVIYSESFRATCPNADLELKWVEIRAQEGGGVALRAYGVERCLCNCIFGRVSISFDDDDPSWTAMEQDTGAGRGGGRYLTGNLIVSPRDGRDKTYTVTIYAEGLTESNMSNNTYRVTVRAGEVGVRKVYCRH